MTKTFFAARAALSLLLGATIFTGASTRAPAAGTAPRAAVKNIAPKPVKRATAGVLGGQSERFTASTRDEAPRTLISPRVETRVSDQTQPQLVDSSSNNGNDATGNNAQAPLPYDLSQVKRLRVAGRLIDETPIRVGNMDVLAPIVGDNSSILSTVGATASRVATGSVPAAVAGGDGQSFQINRADGVPVVMTVGKASAWLNGQVQPLRAAPLVIGGKIWLPIFSVAPLLGASARLDLQTGTLYLNPTIQSVEVFPARGYTVMTIKTSAPIPDGAILMGQTENPPKLYFTFNNYSMGFDAAGTSGERVVSRGYGPVQQVRAGLFESYSDKTRVVLDLGKGMDATVQPLPEKNLFAVVLAPIGTPGSDPPPVIIDVPQPSPVGSSDTLRGSTIVVDAGHGGKDSGAPGRKSLEKNHALDIARRLRTELQKRGANVLMTRDGDYFISLQGRSDFANARQADVFFSVHLDSADNGSASGTSVYYTSSQSLPLAREVSQELLRATGLPNRGIHQRRLWVTRKTTMPSILTESAYMSNPRDEALLMKPEFRQKVASAMAQGISNYFARYRSR